MRKGYFRSVWISEIINPETAFASDIVNRAIKKLTLQVTQDCNFICRYCLFTKDNNIKRTHKKNNMSWDIAKNSIDFLWEHSVDVSEVSIAFYGGEPLLNYELIKKVIEYSVQKFEIKNIKFNMTINGSIMTDEMIDFFAKNNASITISLDGPKEVQNQHRKFYANGFNTFDVVWNNVQRIKTRQPEWFDKCIYFHPVMLPGEDPNAIFNFFQINGIAPQKISVVNSNLEGVDYIKYNDISEKTDSRKENNYAKQFINRNFAEFEKIYYNKSEIPSIWHHNGPCVPGKTKIFVDVNGKIFPCEQVVNEECNSIGDIFFGIDEEKVKQLMNIGKLTEKECRKCFAMRFCNICMKKCYNPETKLLDPKIKEHYCLNARRGVMNCLKQMVLMEK